MFTKKIAILAALTTAFISGSMMAANSSSNSHNNTGKSQANTRTDKRATMDNQDATATPSQSYHNRGANTQSHNNPPNNHAYRDHGSSTQTSQDQ